MKKKVGWMKNKKGRINRKIYTKNVEGIEIHTLKDPQNDLYHLLFNNKRPTIISTKEEVKILCEIQSKYRKLNDKLREKVECLRKIIKGDNKKCY